MNAAGRNDRDAAASTRSTAISKRDGAERRDRLRGVKADEPILAFDQPEQQPVTHHARYASVGRRARREARWSVLGWWSAWAVTVATRLPFSIRMREPVMRPTE